MDDVDVRFNRSSTDSIESRLIRIDSDLIALKSIVNERHNLVLGEVNKLKDNYARHDKDLIRVAVSLESMVKELTNQRNELMRSIAKTQESIENHLHDESLQRDKTMDELKSVGFKVATAVILGGGALIFNILRGG